jgi:hypothetical protein
MKPFNTSRWCKHFTSGLVKPCLRPSPGGNVTPCLAQLQHEIRGSEIKTVDFFHAPDFEVTAPLPSRSLHRRLRGDRATAFEVAVLPHSRSPLDPLNPLRLRRPSPSRRLVHHHLWLLLTVPASNSNYNRCRPPQPLSPSRRRLWFWRAVTMDTFLAPPHRLQLDCPNPASDGVRHHLRALCAATSQWPWVSVHLQSPPPPHAWLHLTVRTCRP